MTPNQLRQTAASIRKSYFRPGPDASPVPHVVGEAMHALAEALDSIADASTPTPNLPPARPTAPAALHEAIDRAWSSVQEHTNGTLATNDDDDVLEQLRILTDDDVRRAGFVLAITRGLSMVVRGDRTIARGES